MNSKYSNYTKRYRGFMFVFFFNYREKVLQADTDILPVSQYSPNSPLSWSVVQQKNGSIKS